MGKKDQAMDAITRAVGLDSTNVEALTWAGFLYNEIHKTPMAKRLLLKGITVNQSCSYCYEYLGDAQIYEGAYELAAQSYEKALATRAYTEETSVKLAKAVLLSGYPEKAAQLFEKILSMNSRNDEALYWLSNAYLEMGMIPQAKQLPSKLKIKQKTGWVHLAQGEVYEAQGKVDAALISFSVASRLMPEEPRTLAAAGRMNLVKEEFEEAVMNFGKALGQDPHNPQYLVNLGEAYEGLGDNESALQFYTEVIRTNPHYARAFYLAARTRSKEGKHVEAIKMLREGLKRKPDNPRFAMALGHEYRATAQYEKAIEFYEKAAEGGGGEFVEGYRHIGTIFLNKLKNEKKAKRYFNKYLKAGGTSEKIKKMVLNMQ
jgi:tetratricopeptide (TPR) repeat protein